jgi:hypothetical protein
MNDGPVICTSFTVMQVIVVRLHATIVGLGKRGVQAVLVTSLGTFTGCAGYPFAQAAAAGQVNRDYQFQEELLQANLLGVDPVSAPRLDESLAGIAAGQAEDDVARLDATVLLAVSKACARAAARHRNLPLYRYLAEVAGSEPRLPLPVPHVAVRAVGHRAGPEPPQGVLVVATEVVSLEGTIEKLQELNQLIHSAILGSSSQLGGSFLGSNRVVDTTLDNLLQVSTLQYSTDHRNVFLLFDEVTD